MAKNNRNCSETRLSVSIPDAHFDELWAAMPDSLKMSLKANPYAVVMDRNGKTTLLRDYVAMKNSEINSNT